MHVNALDGYAYLAGADETAVHGAIHGRLQVGIFQHDHRIFAAQLERTPDQAFRAAWLPTILPVRTLPVNIT